jgi:Type II secretion system (T2SS), protein E, N-terminal domain
MRAVEDAIARQVLRGGDLSTNLLELGAVSETTLTNVLAESLGLPVAPAGKLPSPPDRVLRALPGELALRHGVFPLDLRDRTLSVATAEPLSNVVEDDLGFALGVAIQQLAAPLVRVRQAIADHYGLPLDRRLTRLCAKLDGRGNPGPSTFPPPAHDAFPLRPSRSSVSIPVPSFGTGVYGGASPDTQAPAAFAHAMPPIPQSARVPKDVELLEVSGGAALPSSAGRTGTRFDTLPPSTEPGSPPTAPLPFLESRGVSASVPVIAPPSDTEPLPRTAPDPVAGPATLPDAVVATALTGAASSLVTELAVTEPAVTTSDSPASEDAHRTGPASEPAAESHAEEGRAAPEEAFGERERRALAGWVRKERRSALGEGEGSVAGRAPRRKGPFTTDAAEKELAEAATTDAVLEVFFTFAAQYFAFAALFVIHGEIAEGRLARGLSGAVAGATRAQVAGIGVPLDLPSSLARVRASGAPSVAPLAREGLDAELTRDLGRSAEEPPRAVALIPVVVRSRTVAILYGDDAQVDVELPGLGDVVAFAALVSGSIERLALRKKLGARPSGVAVSEGAPGPRAGTRPPTEEASSGEAPAPVAQAAPLASGAPLAVVPLASGRRTATLPRQSRIAALAQAMSPTDATEAPRVALPPREGEDAPATLREQEEATLREQEEEEVSPSALDAASEPTPSRPSSSALTVLAMSASEPSPSSVDAITSVGRPTRRGQAPPYAGRANVKASTLEPLPPPPNATTWTSSEHSSPPPLTSRPPVSDRPIPREEAPVRTRHSPAPPPLPSASTETSAELASLLTRFTDGGSGSQEAFDEIVRHGEHWIPALMAHFPGPLRVDRHRARAELPPASQCGPILELVIAIRRPALPFVSVRSSSADIETRFWATHALGELRYPEAANVLVPRLFDDEASVRRIARRSAFALVSDGTAGAPILQGLDHITRNAEHPTPDRTLAIETMGEIRSGAMVPPLIAVLADPSDEVGDAARRALLMITRQDFGRDERRWQEWWLRSSGRHRIEWLIDALMHEQPSLRRAAADELKLLTKEYFGYYDDLPKRERERAQAQYRAWWEREGRARFA